MEVLNIPVFGGGSGGGASVAGSNTDIQFNDNGVLAGDSDFTWNSVTKTLTVTGTAVISDGTY